MIEKEKIEAEAELRRSFDVSIKEEDAREVKREFEEQLESGFPLTEDVGYFGEEFAERVSIDPTVATCYCSQRVCIRSCQSMAQRRALAPPYCRYGRTNS